MRGGAAIDEGELERRADLLEHDVRDQAGVAGVVMELQHEEGPSGHMALKR